MYTGELMFVSQLCLCVLVMYVCVGQVGVWDVTLCIRQINWFLSRSPSPARPQPFFSLHYPNLLSFSASCSCPLLSILLLIFVPFSL